ncbi:MAG: hypothetical protein FWF06_07330, partial [Symbiobacteriaceae bacterium]|nr:hypothetical protein [Symbiobacteriaceae bacterium]
TVQVQNNGFLTTAASNKAIAIRAVRPDHVSLTGAEVVNGKERQEIGFLQGFGSAHNERGGGGSLAQSSARVSWIVRAPAGTQLSLTLHSTRGGIKRQKVILGS